MSVQLSLLTAPDLRPCGDPECESRHRQVLAVAPVMRLEAELTNMRQQGAVYWIPDESVLARRLGAAAPRLLFCRGQPRVCAPAVAIVGTRRPDAYGERVARALGRALGGVGVTVVSGGALGIDTEAHRGCLDAGGITTVVLGNGLTQPHPTANQDLFERVVASGGCVLSEAPMGLPASRWGFPLRNRLIAALADAVIVVQAGARSGALITADWANRIKVPVCVTPGDLWYLGNEGGAALMGEGAHPLNHPADLGRFGRLADVRWEGLSWPRPGPRRRAMPSPWDAVPAAVWTKPAGDEERSILKALSNGPLDTDALIATTGLSVGALQAALLGLEIAGQIRSLGGGTWVAL